MAYTVTIKYTGPATDNIRFVYPICPVFLPTNSYVDTTALDGTVYDTNVKGLGDFSVAEPFKTTSFPFPVPLAQFKVAALGTSGTLEITVETQTEALWYKQIGDQIADQGFEVTIAEVEEG